MKFSRTALEAYNELWLKLDKLDKARKMPYDLSLTFSEPLETFLGFSKSVHYYHEIIKINADEINAEYEDCLRKIFFENMVEIMDTMLLLSGLEIVPTWAKIKIGAIDLVNQGILSMYSDMLDGILVKNFAM